MFEVNFSCQKLLLLGIFMMLTHRDETQATEASDPSEVIEIRLRSFTRKGLMPLQPPAMISVSSNADNEPAVTSPSENLSHFSEDLSPNTEVKIDERLNKVVRTSRKLLRDSNKGNVANRQGRDETWFEPGEEVHKGVEVDTAGSIAFTADYRPPRRHPPKNN